MFRPTTAPRTAVRRAALAAVVALALPAAASAQVDRGMWFRQVSTMLDENTAVMARFGGHPSHDTFIDYLDDGAYQDVRLTLRAGRHYVFAGVCDSDCRDLDFRLFDDRYNPVAADTDPDPTPMVEVTPRYTGTFHLRVSMASCTANPCWWGVGVYR